MFFSKRSFNTTFAQILNTDLLYRQVSILILFTSFFVQSFSGSFIIADYYTNTKSYVANCENKARPQMHCNGKCQMIKKISSEEKKDQQSPERKDNKNDITLFCKSFPAFITFFYAQPSKLFSSKTACKEIKMPRSVFHPPVA